MNKLELFSDLESLLGEGPCWLPETQELLWIDILSKKIHFQSSITGKQRSFQLDNRIGCAVPTQSGKIFAAAEHHFILFDPETKEQTFFAGPESPRPDYRFNDGKCDPQGRFWMGTMDEAEQTPIGSLYMVDHNLNAHKKVEHVTVSNGLDWDVEKQTMYYVDSAKQMVYAFSIDFETGDLSERRVIFKIEAPDICPDGLCIDEEGMLWIALWGGWGVIRINPATGEQIDKIDLPVKRVTSCAFGGSKMDELFITTAKVLLSEEELQNQPHAGSVFKIQTSVKGIQTPVFQAN